jgi:hypothetical protein
LVAVGAIALTLLVVASSLAAASAPTAVVVTSTAPLTTAASAANPSAPSVGVPTTTFATNEPLATTVAADEKSFQAHGLDPASLHLPNVHQAPSLASTHGSVAPLYSIAPAPMGVAYYGESNTTGTTLGTTVNTTSLAGTFSTSDPIGTQTEEFDVSTGSSYNDIQPARDSYGAQLNDVLTNVTIFGQTSFYNPKDPGAPTGCPGYAGNPTTGPAPCPNEFWMQNYIEYQPGTHELQIGDEVWNFSNPTASWSGADANSVVGFGSVAYGLYFLTNTPSEYGPTLNIAYPFTLVLYDNVTRGPCHLDTVPGTGVPSCTADGSTVSMTEPVNEVFFNYSLWKTPSQPCPTGDVCQGQHVCPATEPYPGIVCGEYDDLFFNSVNPATPTVGVPVHGPHGQIGSAGIEANGSAYDPVGLTNDYEFDYGIGSDDGDTNSVAYANGTVGVDYCPQSATELNGVCSAYADTPAATDFGGETGETSIGEVGYWAPQGSPIGAGFLTGAGAPLAHLVSGPALLEGLWNMSGSAYPSGSGDHALDFSHIAPANAWIGIAAGKGVTSQSKFQVAPTFGWFSYWKGSGGAGASTALGPNLYLPSGWYTLEVLLSGYKPYIGNVDLTSSGQSPTISLVRDAATGVYTPLWAFSAGDLANISTPNGGAGLGDVGNQYQLDHASPTVGAPFGTSGSLSWLFSNLNDYLFTVWQGEYLNSTTAFAQSNPAPSFLMEYPSWQWASLDFFGVPHSNQFQFYFFHVENFTLAGTSGIYSWGNGEASTQYSVICNLCKNVLIAGNSFEDSSGGVQFLNGGTGAPVGAALGHTRNVVWGNTFRPDLQPAFPGLQLPSAAIVASESFDRFYDNDFDAHGGLSSSVWSSPTYANWWNATCQAGYAPLTATSYPGPLVCEPLSYTQVVNGFSLTGSIVASHYQGGNFWAVYGNAENPYGALPFKDHLTDRTGPGQIGSTLPSFAGDYAPLITTTVYAHAYTEHGLPTSAHGNTFHVQIFAGKGSPVLWQGTSATTTGPANCAAGLNCVTFYLPDGAYQFQVTNATVAGKGYSPAPASGKFIVAGAGVTTTVITFHAVHAKATPELPGGVLLRAVPSGSNKPRA